MKNNQYKVSEQSSMNSWEYDQKVKQERKQAKQLRSLKASRKSFWKEV